jgi:TonB family protein
MQLPGPAPYGGLAVKIAHLVARFIAALTVLFGLAAATSVIGAAVAGAPSLTVYFAKDFTDQGYQRKAYQKVASTWARPAKTPQVSGKTVVITTLGRDGKVLSAVVGTKSGLDAWDEAALQAVRKASPFDPFPAAYANPTTEVHFHFEWAPAPAPR